MATDAQAGKDRDTKDTTSAADRAASGGGKSGTGGSGRAGGVGSPGVGGGFDGTGKGSAGNSKDYSGRGGMDSPSEGGPGRGVSGSSSGSAGNAGGEGEGSRYSGRGGLNSPGEVARAADGFGLNGSSVDAPKNYNYSDLGKTGSVGLYSAALGGPGGPLAGSVGSYSTARGLMGAAGASIPDVTHRQSEIQSMNDLYDLNLDRWTAGIIGVESGGKANARNPNSTAAGLGQFIDSTWTAMMSKTFPGLTASLTPQQVLDLKFDPAISQAITKAYLAENLQNFEKKGIALTPAAAYLSHFLGPGAAAQTLSASPNTPMSSIVSSSVINANKAVFDKNPTAKDIIGWAGRKMDRNMPSLSDTKTIEQPATAQAAPKSNLSKEALEYQYSGRTRQAAPTEVAQYARTARFRDMYISPHLPLNVQGFTEEDVARQTPEVDRVPVGVTTAQTQPAPVPSTPATNAPTTVTTTTAPTALPETGIQPVRTEDRISPTPADDTIEPDKQRSIPAQVAAGGIDVLTGLVPGVGIGASLFNAGAALTGHRTLGERLVDDFLSGDNPGRPAGTRDSDSLLVREDENADGQGEEAEAEAAPVAFDKNRFVRKYLTPAEKWGSAKGLMGAAG